MSDVTQLLVAVEAGDPHAAAELLPLVYEELRTLAAAKLAQEKPGQTLQATALVHEAYLRLVGSPANAAPENAGGVNQWNSRGHFFGSAAEAMRRILVESARRKAREKRGGGWRRRTLDAMEPALLEPDWDLLALDDALTQLEREDPKKAQLVKLRFFAGLTLDQAASAMGISSATA